MYPDADFNQIDFGEFVGEFAVEGIRHIAFEHVMARIKDSGRVSMSTNSNFVAPRRQRPPVKIVLSNNPTGTAMDGFGTLMVNVNKSRSTRPITCSNWIDGIRSQGSRSVLDRSAPK